MLLAIGVFLIVTGIAVGIGWTISGIPDNLAKKRLEKRLREVGSTSITPGGEAASVVRVDEQGPLPGVQRLLGKTGAGMGLSKLIEQSGVRATTGGIVVVSEPPDGSGDRWDASGLAKLGLVREVTEVVEGATFTRLRQVEACPQTYPRRPGVPTRRPLF